jgi:hypothetical protein
MCLTVEETLARLFTRNSDIQTGGGGIDRIHVMNKSTTCTPVSPLNTCAVRIIIGDFASSFNVLLLLTVLDYLSLLQAHETRWTDAGESEMV